MHTNVSEGNGIPGCRLKIVCSKEERAELKRQAQLERRLAQQQAQAQRARNKQIEKITSKSYRQSQIETAKEKKQKFLIKKEKSKNNGPSRIKSRGAKGRAPTVHEKEVMDIIGAIGCIACLMKGRIRPIISMHHTDGRTKKGAHYKCLPLCENHHDVPAEKEIVEQYPDMIPIHAKGAVGGKRAWEALNGTQMDLLKKCYEMVGLIPPADALS